MRQKNVAGIEAGGDADRLAELRNEVSRKIDALVGPAEKLVTDVPGLTVVRRVKPTTPSCLTYPPSLAVITQGRKEVVLGPRTIVYDESRYLLTSIDLPIVSQVREASEAKPFIGLAVTFDLPMVRELLALTEFPGPECPAESPAMVTGQTTVEILDACRRLVDLVGNAQEIAALSGLIRREIVFRVLQGAEGSRLRAIAAIGNQSHRTAKAVEWIRKNYAKPLRVEELAEMSGMAVSTFHHHFRLLTSMSPVQYQKQIRLQEARKRMISESVDAATAAFEVGYESASQFSREYRRQYGQPPLRDIRQLRAG